jgi:hypothetical protein
MLAQPLVAELLLRVAADNFSNRDTALFIPASVARIRAFAVHVPLPLRSSPGVFVQGSFALFPQALRQRIALLGTRQWFGPHVRAPLRFLVRRFGVSHLRRLRVPKIVHVVAGAAPRVSVITNSRLLCGLTGIGWGGPCRRHPPRRPKIRTASCTPPREVVLEFWILGGWLCSFEVSR